MNKVISLVRNLLECIRTVKNLFKNIYEIKMYKLNK